MNSPTNTASYRYYVAYSHGYGFGATEIHRSTPITTFEQVTNTAKVIEKHAGIDRVVILNFQLMGAPADAFGAHGFTAQS